MSGFVCGQPAEAMVRDCRTRRLALPAAQILEGTTTKTGKVLLLSRIVSIMPYHYGTRGAREHPRIRSGPALRCVSQLYSQEEDIRRAARLKCSRANCGV